MACNLAGIDGMGPEMTDIENLIDTIKDGVLLETQANDAVEALRQLDRIAEASLQARDCQRRYFKERSQSNLVASKQAEKVLDDLLREYRA